MNLKEKRIFSKAVELGITVDYVLIQKSSVIIVASHYTPILESIVNKTVSAKMIAVQPLAMNKVRIYFEQV